MRDRQVRNLFAPARLLGDGAGLLALCLLAFSLAGAVWALVRPTVSVEVTSGSHPGLIPVDGEADTLAPGFEGFLLFIALTGLCGLVVGLWCGWRVLHYRLLTLFWLAVSCLAGAISSYYVGVFIDGLHFPDPAEIDLQSGTQFVLPAPIQPGIGLVIAPLFATAGYWCVRYFKDLDDQVAD